MFFDDALIFQPKLSSTVNIYIFYGFVELPKVFFLILLMHSFQVRIDLTSIFCPLMKFPFAVTGVKQ